MVDTMRAPFLLIITGPPASGKTTLGIPLSERLGLPYLYKDAFKEIMFDVLGWKDRAWSKQLGNTSTEILFYITKELLRAGVSMALESNFDSSLATPRLQAIIATYHCCVFQVVCSAARQVLQERYRLRAELGLRHPGHLDQQLQTEFSTNLPVSDDYRLTIDGPAVIIDTSVISPVGFDQLEEQIRIYRESIQ